MSDPFNREGKNDPQRESLFFGKEDKEEQVEVEYSSFQLWEVGNLEFNNMGIHLDIVDEVHPLVIRNTENLKPENGYNPPEDFRAITPEFVSNEGNSARRQLSELLTSWQFDNKQLYHFWKPLLSPKGRESGSPLYQYVYGLLRHNSKGEITGLKQFLDGINLDIHEKSAKKFVPPLSWFDERIRQLTAQDLVTFFYPEELELFMLQIGRVTVGRNETIHTNGEKLDHTFRNFSIIVGEDAGMGKSTLMNNLISALTYCGYDVAILQENERFGWGKIVRSDLAYVDDLTRETQRKLITSGQTKQIISNGVLSTEKKGIDPIDHKSKTTMMACSNSYDPSDFYNMDTGLISRCKLLYSLTYAEIKQIEDQFSEISRKSPNKRIKEHWAYLCEVLDTEKIVLSLYFLRLCTDKFLESIKPPQEKENIDPDNNFMNQIKLLSFKSVIKPIQDDVKSLLTLPLLMMVIAKKGRELYRKHGLSPVKSQSIFCYKLFRQNAQIDIHSTMVLMFLGIELFSRTYIEVNESNVDSKELKFKESFLFSIMKKYQSQLKELHYYSLENPLLFQQKINKYSIDNCKNLLKKGEPFRKQEADIAKFIFNGIRSIEGFRLSGEISWVQNAWYGVLPLENHFESTFDYLLKETNNINPELTEIQSLQLIETEIFSLLKEHRNYLKELYQDKLFLETLTMIDYDDIDKNSTALGKNRRTNKSWE
jgi:hypothetical protein